MKTICPPRYHHNGFVATHALGYMMYGYRLLIPVNQRVLNKLNKEYIVSGHKSTTTHSVEQNGHNIYVIIQTICPFGYHLDGLATTHALGHIMLSYSYINFHPLKYILEHA